MNIYLTLGALLLATGLSKGQSQILKDTQDILDTILSGYNSDIRPAFNQSLPVEVNITTIYMFHITEFKEVSEQLTSVLALDLLWEDYRLTWDPLNHNGTEYVHIPVTKIWKPYLILTSPIDRNIPIGVNQNWMVIKCYYDGSIEWTIPDIVTSRCGIDIRYFPFDTQNCNMLFVPGGYYSGEVLLIGGDETISLIYYTENGGWILEESQVLYEYSPFGVSEYTINMKLKRRPHYFLVNVVLPIIFTSFLSGLVFLIPLESGERLSYAVSVFLAMAVFMTIVGENIPKTSLNMAYMSYFLLLHICHSALICFETIICLATYYRQGSPPSWLAYILSITCALPKIRNKITNIKSLHDNGNQTDLHDDDGAEDNQNEVSGNALQKDEKRIVSWRDVSRKLDKLFSLGAFIILITSISVLVIVVSLQ